MVAQSVWEETPRRMAKVGHLQQFYGHCLLALDEIDIQTFRLVIWDYYLTSLVSCACAEVDI